MLTLPRLDGIAVERQLRFGERAAARAGCALLQAGVADAGDWTAAERNPLRFLQLALDRWTTEHGKAQIEEQFQLDLTLSTELADRDAADPEAAADPRVLFLIVEPSSAGCAVLGPALRTLEAVHPRLPATFAALFLDALNRWVRVYDYRDARERVETLRDWYESDDESEPIELPDVDGATPARRTSAAADAVEDPRSSRPAVGRTGDRAGAHLRPGAAARARRLRSAAAGAAGGL